MITYRNQKDRESFWYMAGFVVFSIFIAGSFLFQISAPFTPVMEAVILPIHQYYLYMHGVFILMFCMMMILRERIRTIYYKATKSAADLAKLSESLEQLVQERTKELEATNAHLQASMHETSQALAEIAVLEDRNRIAQEMHDHVGYDLTAALIQIEAAKMLISIDAQQAYQKLEATRDTVKNGLQNIRETVRMMRDEYEERELIPALQHLILTTQTRTGVSVQYEPHPLPELNANTKKTLFLALREGLTNGIRHGNASDFVFTLFAAHGAIRFELSNIGKRYEPTHTGFGLKTMGERVERLGGSLHIDDNDGKGCKISIEIPI